MKKAICALLLMAMLLSLAVSCGNRNGEPDGTESTTESSVSETLPASGSADNDSTAENPPEVTVTVEDVTALFDDNVYQVQIYDEQMVASVRENLTLSGDITSILYIVHSQTSAPDLEWVYVYEFAMESDAVWMEENRRQFVSSIEGGICIRLGNIVVYGNSAVLDALN